VNIHQLKLVPYNKYDKVITESLLLMSCWFYLWLHGTLCCMCQYLYIYLCHLSNLTGISQEPKIISMKRKGPVNGQLTDEMRCSWNMNNKIENFSRRDRRNFYAIHTLTSKYL